MPKIKRLLMQHILFISLLLFMFTGCQDKEQAKQEQATHDAKIAAQARTELLAELHAKRIAQNETKKATKLNTMGIDMHNGTLTIDTNKTKKFLNTMGKSIETQMLQISKDLEKGILETKEAGIQINNERINIDLNKTKNFLEEWGKKIQVFAKEFDSITHNLDNNTTIKGN